MTKVKPVYKSQFSVPAYCVLSSDDDNSPTDTSPNNFTGNEHFAVFYTPRFNEIPREQQHSHPLSPQIIGRSPSIKNKNASPFKFPKHLSFKAIKNTLTDLDIQSYSDPILRSNNRKVEGLFLFN
uniref:Uncharacterized protein n=1 Tax=Panagrolaimus superbus TaxID=310955 RepID=A0A914Z8Y7_9BILA